MSKRFKPVFIALAQLMIALDATVMNVALPALQRDLGFSNAARQWVISAYGMAFGSLLLLGGRLADRIGQERAFQLGLLGFALVSALGGLATGLPTLCLARAAQGAFAALLAPAALALIAAHAEATGDRGRTFALFGAIAGSGGALGLVLGGLLTENFGWRVCLWVNLPVAALAALGARRIDRSPRAQRASLDALSALLVSAALAALLFACSRLAAGREAATSWLLLLAAGAALVLFVRRQARTARPLLPLRILRDRNRAVAYLSGGIAVAGMLGMFLSLSYQFQTVRGYSPLQAGLAFLPLSAAVFASAQLIGRVLPRLGARRLIVLGFCLGSTAMLLLTRSTEHAGYLQLILPAELLLGLGMGAVFTPVMSTATARIERADAGVAAATLHAAQQTGGALGVTLLNAALVRGGHAMAAGVSALLMAAGALLAASLMRPQLTHERKAS